MAEQVFPTKGNLIASKKSLELSRLGYDLLDRKRNILIREMMQLIDVAYELQGKIDKIYGDAYKALQKANITMGYSSEFSLSIPVEETLAIDYRSVMGIELPIVELQAEERTVHYSLSSTNSLFDQAYLKFQDVKILTAKLAEIETSVYFLANAIRKTQTRANALKNIMIPNFESTIKWISESLEEKEREDFSRLKVIKSKKKTEEP